MKQLYFAICIVLSAAAVNAQVALDHSFGINGIVQTGFGYHGLETQNTCKQVLLTPNGNFYLLIEYRDQTFLVRRLPNGTLDNTYGENGYSAGAWVRDAHGVLMPDGSVVIGGSSFGIDLNWNFKLMRFLPNGKLDITFGNNGMQLTDFHGENDLMYAIVLQPDNKIVTAGLSGSHFGVARYLPNGMLDISFSQDGKDTINFGSLWDVPSGIAVKNDGRIVIVGQSVFGPQKSMSVACYLPDGTRDNSFSGDGLNNYAWSNECAANAVAVHPSGKIVLAGLININYNMFAVVQLNADGSLDNSFSGDGLQTVAFTGWDEAFAVTIDYNGKIVAGGYGFQQWIVTRINPDGSPDLSMNGNGKTNLQVGLANSRLYSLAIQSDGKILAAGEASFGLTRYVAGRFNANGTLDFSFGQGAYIADYKPSSGTSYVTSAVQPDGKLITVGLTYTKGDTANVCIARYNINGTLDNSFSGDGKLLFRYGTGQSNASALVIQPDGKIVIGGSYYTDRVVGTYKDIDFALARFNVDGSPDMSFSTDGIVLTQLGGMDFIHSISLQPDGKIICGGMASLGPPEQNTNSDFALVRYNSDGSLDNSFSGDGIYLSDLSYTDEGINKVLLQPDGKIVAAGILVPAYSAMEVDFAVARYNANGTPDLSFNGTGMRTIDIGESDLCNAAALTGNGTILLAGHTYEGSGAQLTMVRLLTNGQLDNSFSGDGIMTYGTHITCYGLAIQPNGQIIAGGGQLLYPDYDALLARFNVDGSLDDTFAPGGIITTGVGERENLNSLSIFNNRLYGAGQSSYDGSTGLVIAYSLGCLMDVVIPNATSLPAGVAPNTVYPGYAPAADLTLHVQATGGTPPYSYSWSNGATSASITITPPVAGTWSVTVTDATGCAKTANRYVNVVDVHCGNKMDKVLICQNASGTSSNQHSLCVSSTAVETHLNHGASLGSCNSQLITSANNIAAEELTAAGTITLEAYPNPGRTQFTLVPKFPGKALIQMVVFDELGRIVEKRTINSNQQIQLGAKYRPGVYLVECIQGDARARIKLVKQP